MTIEINRTIGILAALDYLNMTVPKTPVIGRIKQFSKAPLLGTPKTSVELRNTKTQD